ncbi:MAG: Dolichol kinase [Candidatus Midichloriaceae bacterium]|nr:Dolichol kinase [Candidatus Midichloriaceae bacterium]
MHHKNSISYNYELLRKGLHLGSLWMPAAIWYLGYLQSVLLFGVLFALALWYERLRLCGVENCREAKLFGIKSVYKILAKIAQSLLREHEDERGKHRSLTGATYMLAAIFITLIIFPKLIVITAIVIMLIGDSFAAIVGRKFGKSGYRGKSWIGSLAFVISSLAAVSILGVFLGQGAHYLLSAYLAVIAAF